MCVCVCVCVCVRGESVQDLNLQNNKQRIYKCICRFLHKARLNARYGTRKIPA